MIWSDPVVDEVRRLRDAYAARFNYDLRAIYRDLKEQEKRGGRKLVSYADDATETAQNKDWRKVVGAFHDSEYMREVDDECLRQRELEREAARQEDGAA